MVETPKKFPAADILRTPDICEYLGVGRELVHTYARMPGFPRLPGRSVRVYRPALDAWLSKQRNPDD